MYITKKDIKRIYNYLLDLLKNKHLHIFKNYEIAYMLLVFYELMPIYLFNYSDYDEFFYNYKPIIKNYRKLSREKRPIEYEEFFKNLSKYDSYIMTKNEKNYIKITPMTPEIEFTSIELKGKHYEVK